MVLISTYISFEVEFRRLGTFRAQIKFRLFFRSSDWPEVIICMNQKKMFEPLFPLDRYKDSLKPFTISSTRFFVKPSTSANFSCASCFFVSLFKNLYTSSVFKEDN